MRRHHAYRQDCPVTTRILSTILSAGLFFAWVCVVTGEAGERGVTSTQHSAKPGAQMPDRVQLQRPYQPTHGALCDLGSTLQLSVALIAVILPGIGHFENSSWRGTLAPYLLN